MAACFHLVQAAEEARKAQEKAARKAAEEAAAAEAARREAEAADPVLRLRSFLMGKRSAKDTAMEVKGLNVEGGLAGRMRVFYEVWTLYYSPYGYVQGLPSFSLSCWGESG